MVLESEKTYGQLAAEEAKARASRRLPHLIYKNNVLIRDGKENARMSDSENASRYDHMAPEITTLGRILHPLSFLGLLHYYFVRNTISHQSHFDRLARLETAMKLTGKLKRGESVIVYKPQK